MTFEDILKPSIGKLTAPAGTFDSRTLLPLPVSIRSRIAEMETENRRLQRLVAELLLKNQQLRGIAE